MLENANITDRPSAIKRHVLGLRLASSLLALMNFLFLVTSIVTPSFLLPLASKGSSLAHLLVFIIALALAVFVNAKNYFFFLIISVGSIVLFYLSYRYFLTIDFLASAIDPDLGAGRGGDYQFLLQVAFITLSVVYLRFKVVLFMTAFMVFFLCLEVATWYLAFEGLFFSNDYSVIFSNPNAINQIFFTGNVFVAVTTVFIVLLVSWYVERLTDQAAVIETNNAELGRYFSPSVKEEIIKEGLSSVKNKKNKSMVAVLFTDINKFSSITESMDPEDVLELVSQYQTKMVAAIFASGGTVDKFIGDAVMATFGTPVSRGNDAQNAFECSRLMQVSMRRWAKEREEQNLPVISHRIGIHFGECVIGNVGSDERREYTVLGDAVNVASRLCDACKDFDTELLISEEVKNRLSENIESNAITDFAIRGRKSKINVYALSV